MLGLHLYDLISAVQSSHNVIVVKSGLSGRAPDVLGTRDESCWYATVICTHPLIFIVSK